MRVFDFDRAIVRTPGATVVNGLRTGADSPSYEGVLAEHRAYVAALEEAGLTVDTQPPLEGHPDSIFVEDAAFTLPEGAIMLRPGAPTRMDEPAALAPALRAHFVALLEVDEGYADGGDILILPDEILIGCSTRTDRLGAKRFAELAAQLGRRTRIVQTPPGVLHLKTGCSLVDEGTIIAVPALAETFPQLEVIVTPAGEEGAANLLRVNDRLLLSDRCPRTADLLAGRGLGLLLLPTTEIAKIDAGLSCMSLRWRAA